MQINHHSCHKLSSAIKYRIEVIKDLANQNNESANIASSFSSKINEYSNKMRKALNHWYGDSQDIQELLSSIDLSNSGQAIQILQGATHAPSSGHSYNTISGQNAMDFYNWAKGMPQELLENIKVTGFTITYKDSSTGKVETYSNSSSNYPGNPPLTMQAMVNAADAIKRDDGPIQGISIELTPKQASDDISSIEYHVLQQPGMPQKVESLQSQIAQIQSHEKKRHASPHVFFQRNEKQRKGLKQCT